MSSLGLTQKSSLPARLTESGLALLSCKLKHISCLSLTICDYSYVWICMWLKFENVLDAILEMEV